MSRQIYYMGIENSDYFSRAIGNNYCNMIKQVVFLLSKHTVDNKIRVVLCDVPAGPLYLIRLCNIQHLAFPAF